MSISAATVMELRNTTGAGMMDCKHALQETGGDLEQAKDFLRKKGIAVAAKKSSRETSEGGIAIAYSDDRGRAAMVRLASETDFVARNDQFQTLLQALARQVLENGDADVLAQTMATDGGTVQEQITQAISTMGENLQYIEGVREEAPQNGLVGGYVHSNGKIGVLIVLGAGHGARRDSLEELAKDLAMHVAASQVHAVRSDQIDPQVVAKEREILTAQAEESGKPPEIVAKMVEGRMGKFVREVSLLDQQFVKDPEKSVNQVVSKAATELGTEITLEKFAKFQF
ncbi:MAG: translation elongation factor Ts [SAR324 cluster bacterium]|nr:translation elongation factor Ts [SAR324 cluster bacterium]MCZ6532005.1 translation elongation factor Ts [SAR324 cluster bacterium]